MGRYILSLAYSYNGKPLVVKDESNAVLVQDVINAFHAFHFGGAYRLRNNLAVGFSSAFIGVDPAGQNLEWKLQDTMLKLNYTFLKRKKWALGILPFVTIPTGDGDLFLSDGSLGYGAQLIGQYWRGKWSFLASGGYRHANDAIHDIDGALDFRERLIVTLGLLRALSQKWSFSAEYRREFTLPLEGDINQNELFLSARYAVSENLGVFFGGGLGSFESTDSNKYRLLAGVKYSPQKRNTCRYKSVVEIPFRTMLRFPRNKSVANSKKLLKKLVEYVNLNKDKIQSVRVVGHTSAVGTEELNLKLSQKRAEGIKEIILTEGVPGKFLIAEGRGETELLSLENSSEDHKLNRRVEVLVELFPKRKRICD